MPGRQAGQSCSRTAKQSSCQAGRPTSLLPLPATACHCLPLPAIACHCLPLPACLQIIIVDEFTGRTMPGRRWSDGLHQVHFERLLRWLPSSAALARLPSQPISQF